MLHFRSHETPKLSKLRRRNVERAQRPGAKYNPAREKSVHETLIKSTHGSRSRAKDIYISLSTENT